MHLQYSVLNFNFSVIRCTELYPYSYSVYLYRNSYPRVTHNAKTRIIRTKHFLPYGKMRAWARFIEEHVTSL